MARITPPLYARGLYTVNTPWQLTASTVYTCKAIRSFDDLYELGKDVYEIFYKPMVNVGPDPEWIDEAAAIAAFEADRDERAAIITLINDDGTEVVYVPDTYITSYPGMDGIDYSRMVIALDLGALPDYLDLDFLKSELESTALGVIGVNATAQEMRAPTTGHVTPANHAANEVARQAAITVSETEYARNERLQAQVDALTQEKDALKQILIDEGYLQPPP